MFTPFSTSNGAARLGTLVIEGQEPIETPALLVHTLSGSLPSVTSELATEMKDFRLASVDLSEVIDFPSPMFALPESTVTLLGLPYSISPPLGMASKKGVDVETFNGRKAVSPATLRVACSNLNPTMVTCVADDVPFTSGQKRVGKSTERTLQWLKEYLASSPPKRGPCPVVLATLGGGSDLAVRRKCSADVMAAIEEASRRTPSSPSVVCGAVVSGLGSGETRKEREAAAAASLAPLPPAMLRVASAGFQSPSEVLDAVALGLDVVRTALPYLLTRNGQALTLPLETSPVALREGGVEKGEVVAASAAAAATEEAPLKKSRVEEIAPGSDGEPSGQHVLNLHDACHRKDTRPLLPGCSCHACRHHTRAYIHHLLLAHEMLAEVLLQLHNTQHCLDFFARIREHLHTGTLEELREQISA